MSFPLRLRVALHDFRNTSNRRSGTGIGQSANQPTNQSINHPTIQSLNQPTNQPMNQPVGRPINLLQGSLHHLLSKVGFVKQHGFAGDTIPTAQSTSLSPANPPCPARRGCSPTTVKNTFLSRRRRYKIVSKSINVKSISCKTHALAGRAAALQRQNLTSQCRRRRYGRKAPIYTEPGGTPGEGPTRKETILPEAPGMLPGNHVARQPGQGLQMCNPKAAKHIQLYNQAGFE